MKPQKNYWIILICLLVLTACQEPPTSQLGGKKSEAISSVKTDAIVVNQDTQSTILEVDTIPKEINLEYDKEKLASFETINARFINFHLGDAPHYTFEDVNGNRWDFADCNVPGYGFDRELPEEEMNSDNQGWGSEKETQGLWFKLYIEQDKRQIYIDGPIGFVNVVRTGFLIDPLETHIQTELDLSITSYKTSKPLYEYNGQQSADNKTTLKTKDLDHDFYSILVEGEYVYYNLKAPPLSSVDFYWSKADEYVVLNNTDLYSYSGTNDIIVFHINSGLIAIISKENIIQGIDIGEREMLNIKKIAWIDDTTFIIESYISYLGTSGHPGIDQNRQIRLGDNFADTTNIVILPTMQVSITNDKKLPFVR